MTEKQVAVGLNALTLGLRSSRVVLPGEDRAAFENLCESLAAEWQPAMPTEGHLVVQIAVSIWKLHRMEGLEQFCGAGMIHRSPQLLARIWEQQGRLERSRTRATAELQRLRKARRGEPAPRPRAAAGTESLEHEPAPKPPRPAYVMHAGAGAVDASLAAEAAAASLGLS